MLIYIPYPHQLQLIICSLYTCALLCRFSNNKIRLKTKSKGASNKSSRIVPDDDDASLQKESSPTIPRPPAPAVKKLGGGGSSLVRPKTVVIGGSKSCGKPSGADVEPRAATAHQCADRLQSPPALHQAAADTAPANPPVIDDDAMMTGNDDDILVVAKLSPKPSSSPQKFNAIVLGGGKKGKTTKRSGRSGRLSQEDTTTSIYQLTEE